MLTLRLFGGASIETDAGPLMGAAVQRRRLALLALLAATPAGMSRARVAAFLFPEADSGRAHRALSDAIHGVRKVLGRGAVIAVGDALRLDPVALASDIGEFETRLAAGELEEAVALYRGPFLDGFFIPDAEELEHWIEAQRTRLAGRYGEALETLAAAAERSGDHATAAGWWRRLAVHDPYNSRSALRLARALAAVGDPAGALQHARTHLTRLRDELGVEGDVEVRAFVERLQSQEAARPPGPGSRIRGGGEDLARHDGRREGATTAVLDDTSAALGAAVLRRPRQRRLLAVGAGAAAVLATVSLTVLRSVAGGGGAAGRVESNAAVAHVNPEARELYLRGRQLWNERSREGLELAVQHFRDATERDPDYALAYAGLADAYVMLGYLAYRPAAAMFPKGKAAAMRALEIDSTLAEAYAPLGQALVWERDWAGAEHAFRKAIALKPDYATAHQWYGILLVPLGRIQEAVEHTRAASRLDPLSRQINNMHGMLLHYAGDHDGALQHYRRIVEQEPDSAWVRQNPWLLSNASRVYTAHHEYEEALSALEHALTIVPRHPRLLWDLASTYAAMGERGRARQAFAAADTANEQYPFFRGAVFAALGEKDSAFAWFDRVTVWGPSPLGELRMDPRLDPIRGDPRYLALLRRLRLIE